MKPEPLNRGLDALNLLLSGAGAAYGAFIPVYLTSHAWTQTRIGLVLTVATLASMACQVPAGLLVDALASRRRTLLFLGVLSVGITPLVFALWPRNLPILLAMLLQAVAGSALSPAIAATSLAVAGRAGFGERLGRNSRYGSIGAGLGAAMMGACTYFGTERTIFIIAAILVFPALWALRKIGPDREQTTADQEERPGLLAPLVLLRERRLFIFALCLALFQLASIAVLQLAAVATTARLGGRAGLVIAAFLIVPQVVVALFSPAIGRAAERYGRRTILLISFATVPLRGAFFALLRNPYTLIPVQVLEGAGGAAFGVMMPLVAADLTRKSGHYTLCLSLLGLASGLGTALSTSLAGWVTDGYGRPAAYWVLAATGLAAVALVAFAMPETRPAPESPAP